MDLDQRSPAAGTGRGPSGRRLPLGAGLALALAVVAALTLVPEGSGWAWGAPGAELRWYLTGLASPATLLQLVGNLLLLAAPAALAVRLWPGLAAAGRLAAVALATGGAIEGLQLLLPLGRVVSPVDALLNAVGAVLVGAIVAAADRTGSGPVGAPGTAAVDGATVAMYR
ncbi:hypothetical protein SAMN05660690_3755 [Geodermatophilus telluris]|uniref:VanZ like family protein n=1 Tax=Geodermatophilus telluris TaxID=1190417 RepID=A0A1G6T4X2_9ACTN|nr:VanZ family protein [Geodermatophilus telluris]SDD24210.1 hypothetical protein SAMN05660690_3755 [Geodermatophilus telluris]